MLRSLEQIRQWEPAARCRAAGFCLFAIAFFIPAGRFAFEQSGQWRGWSAAWWTLVNAYGFAVRTDYNHFWQQCLLGFSGLVSPLVVVFLLLSISRKAISLRFLTALLSLLLLIVSNITIFWSGHLLEERVIPLAGHYCWTAGILLLLVPELAALKHSSP